MKLTGNVPTYEEVVTHDPRWVSDILLLDRVNRWLNNKSAPMMVLRGDQSPPAPEGSDL